MYSSDTTTEDSERTAFRKAEKNYKLYYDHNAKSSKKKRLPRSVDFSQVLDFKSILDSYNCNGELPPGVSLLKCHFAGHVFRLESRPGFYFIPGGLSIEEQCKWIKESLTNFPQPPNRTNHNAIYGPIHDLFIAAKERKLLVVDEYSESEKNSIVNGISARRWSLSEDPGSLLNGHTCKSVLESVLLRKLRWSTLGLQFDWSKRSYTVSLPHNKIPDALCQLVKKMASPACHQGRNSNQKLQ